MNRIIFLSRVLLFHQHCLRALLSGIQLIHSLIYFHKPWKLTQTNICIKLSHLDWAFDEILLTAKNPFQLEYTTLSYNFANLKDIMRIISYFKLYFFDLKVAMSHLCSLYSQRIIGRFSIMWIECASICQYRRLICL